MSNFKILDQTELNSSLKTLKDWEIDANSLHLALTFESFTKAMSFINEVATVADKLDHHPKIINIYNKVELFINTHEADDKITDLDINFAKEVSNLL